jgi:hypothetical protein
MNVTQIRMKQETTPVADALALSHALSTGLHRLACAILQPDPAFGPGDAVSLACLTDTLRLAPSRPVSRCLQDTDSLSASVLYA